MYQYMYLRVHENQSLIYRESKYRYIYLFINVWFVFLFNGISTFVGYLMLKPIS